MTEESRFSRWSRMKTKARPKGRGIFFKTPDPAPEEQDSASPDVRDQEPVETASVADHADDAGSSDVSQVPGEQEEEDYPEDLPPIESLNKDSDFTAFMSDRVSDKIRNAALRKLWVSNPTLANLDGLIDYGEDLTGSFKVVENMQSVYKVGRGMVDYEAEAKLAEENAREKEEEERLAAEKAESEEPERDDQVDDEADDSGDSVEASEEIETAEDSQSIDTELDLLAETVETPAGRIKNA